ncbi:MAG: hypothetical protein FJ291_11890 [Planctomycetes bacterium]|nr:hypothetical protein [Planctomycetota bacterium]
MPDPEKQQHKQWVDTWKRAGPMLEDFRYEELRRFRHEDNVKIIDALLEMGYRHRVNVPTSGLAELPRLLAKARR